MAAVTAVRAVQEGPQEVQQSLRCPWTGRLAAAPIRVTVVAAMAVPVLAVLAAASWFLVDRTFRVT